MFYDSTTTQGWKHNRKDAISPEELRESALWLFKWSQQTINLDTVDKNLILASDEQGVLRAHGRLENIRSLPDEMCNPIILPRGHQSVNLLLKYLHEKQAHWGYKSLVYESRKRFWIVGVRNIAKQGTGKCMTCKQLRSQPLEQMMGQIPRLRMQQVSQHSATQQLTCLNLCKYESADKHWRKHFYMHAYRSGRNT